VSALSFSGSGTSADGAFAQRFSTRDLQPKEQFDAWRSMLAHTIDLLPTAEAAETFEAEFSCWTFGDVVFTRTLYANAPVRHWRHRQRSFLDHWCVVLARAGTGGECSLSLTNASQGNLSFRSLAMPFEGQAEDTEVLTLFLPRDFCPGELDNFERAHELGIDPELQPVLAGYLENLARYLPLISPDRAQGLSGATCSLVAACIAGRSEHVEAHAPLASPLIDRARLVVRQNMASPEFGPEQLARLMAMSRSKLYRFFESTGGVAHFINRERLREAHRRLTSPRDGLSIHVIGNEVGFVDHSTFSRAFRREFGYSPTEARERSLSRLSAQPFDVCLDSPIPDGAPGSAAARGDGNDSAGPAPGNRG
jgi:AraC-like DNA-binding protein